MIHRDVCEVYIRTYIRSIVYERIAFGEIWTQVFFRLNYYLPFPLLSLDIIHHPSSPPIPHLPFLCLFFPFISHHYPSLHLATLPSHTTLSTQMASQRKTRREQLSSSPTSRRARRCTGSRSQGGFSQSQPRRRLKLSPKTSFHIGELSHFLS